MSTLKVTNIAGLSGSSTDVMQGLAKAWSTHDSSASVSDSFNSSSITDFGTGHFGLNLSSSMGNVYYPMSGSNLGSTANYGTFLGSDGAAVTTSRMDYKVWNYSTGLVDQTSIRPIAHGDLA